MFDVYQKKSDPMERVVVVHSCALPPIFPETEWKFMGKISSVSENVQSHITERGFFVYRTSKEFKEGGGLQI